MRLLAASLLFVSAGSASAFCSDCYCGTSWGDASARCHAPCVNGVDADCAAYAGEHCFSSCTACPTPAPGPTPPPAPTPPPLPTPSPPPTPPAPADAVVGVYVTRFGSGTAAALAAAGATRILAFAYSSATATPTTNAGWLGAASKGNLTALVTYGGQGAVLPRGAGAAPAGTAFGQYAAQNAFDGMDFDLEDLSCKPSCLNATTIHAFVAAAVAAYQAAGSGAFPLVSFNPGMYNDPAGSSVYPRLLDANLGAVRLLYDGLVKGAGGAAAGAALLQGLLVSVQMYNCYTSVAYPPSPGDGSFYACDTTTADGLGNQTAAFAAATAAMAGVPGFGSRNLITGKPAAPCCTEQVGGVTVCSSATQAGVCGTHCTPSAPGLAVSASDGTWTPRNGAYPALYCAFEPPDHVAAAVRAGRVRGAYLWQWNDAYGEAAATLAPPFVRQLRTALDK